MSSDEMAAGEVAIEATGLGKCYQVYRRPADRLLQGLAGRRRRYYTEFWALRGVDLAVRRGETVGIIGRNGSGKSTLLQLVAGTLTKTEGCVRTHGKVAALLELGSGFNPDFTGRENVFLNAALLGLSRAQIEERFGRISEFADIGEFIDQPIRNYSSGMVMRLAFAVIAHVDAEILIIDEALAVGDAFFTQKCMRYLREFRQSGTLLFVSHDGAAVTGLCDRAIWLETGTVRLAGPAAEVMEAYTEAFISDRQAGAARTEAQARVEPQVSTSADIRQDLIDRSQLRNDIHVPAFEPGGKQGFGRLEARIVDVALLDAQGRRLPVVLGGEMVKLEITVRASRSMRAPIVGFYLKDRLGQLLFGDNTWLTEPDMEVREGGTLRAGFTFRMPRLQAGDYVVTAGVAEGSQEEHLVQHWIHDALLLRSNAPSTPTGIIGIPMQNIVLEAS